MNGRPQVRLRLVVAAGILESTPRPPLKRRTRKPNPRTCLLRTLREQRQKIAGQSYFKRTDAPDLYDLALAADRVPQGRRTFIFRGVRFHLKFGFRRYVCDPKTGDILIGGGFLA